MHCDQIGLLLSEFVEDRLPATQRAEVVEHVRQCPYCQQDVEHLQALADMAEHWVDAPVPNWQPVSPFSTAPTKKPWMSWLSLAFSISAFALVFSQANLQINDQGFHLSFGQPAAPALDVAALEKRLDLFEQQQQINVSNQLTAWEITQQESNQKVLTTMLAYSREQQRRDLAQFVDYWETVRAEDQVQQGQVFNRLIDTQQQSRSELRALKAAVLTTTTPSEDL